MRLSDQKTTSITMGQWALIFGIVFAAANLRAPLTSVGPLVEAVRLETGISNTLAGMLTTIPLLALAVFSPLAPLFARRFGLEYTLFGSFILLMAGIILRSIPTLTTLFAGTGLIGAAIAAGNVLIPGLIKRDFPHKVGLMMGVYAIVMNLWGAIASGISIPLAQSLGYGWHAAMGCWAVLSIVSIAVWLPQLFVHRQPANRQLAGGDSLLRSGLAWKITLFMGLQSFCFYVMASWLPAILHEQGMKPASAGWMLSLVQFACLPATFVVPILAGRSSNQRLLVILTAAFFLIGYIGLLGGNVHLTPVYAVLIGIGTGAAFGLANMFFVMRTHNAHQAAQLSGMAQSFGYLLAAAGPALFGFLHDMTHTWTIPLLLLIMAVLLLFVFGWGAGGNRYVMEQDQAQE